MKISKTSIAIFATIIFTITFSVGYFYALPIVIRRGIEAGLKEAYSEIDSKKVHPMDEDVKLAVLLAKIPKGSILRCSDMKDSSLQLFCDDICDSKSGSLRDVMISEGKSQSAINLATKACPRQWKSKYVDPCLSITQNTALDLYLCINSPSLPNDKTMAKDGGL